MLVPKEVNGVEILALVVHATPSPGPRDGKCFIFVATAIFFFFFLLQVYRHCWEPQEQSSSGWGEGSNPYLHSSCLKMPRSQLG